MASPATLWAGDAISLCLPVAPGHEATLGAPFVENGYATAVVVDGVDVVGAFGPGTVVPTYASLMDDHARAAGMEPVSLWPGFPPKNQPLSRIKGFRLAPFNAGGKPVLAGVMRVRQPTSATTSSGFSSIRLTFTRDGKRFFTELPIRFRFQPVGPCS